MLISVIIPAYNSEKTLEQCLKSVLSQTEINFEVIVVDNNSTDKTKEIINHFCKIDKRVRYVFEPKKGRGAARNAGIKLAKGKIIAMTDSDCIVPNNWLKEITKPIANNIEYITMGSQKDLINNFWTKNKQIIEEKNRRKNVKDGYINMIDTKNFAIKTSLLKKLLFDDSLLFCEDVDLYIRIKLKKYKIRYLDSIFVYHYHQSSFLSFINREFNFGYWNTKIYKKYKNYKDIVNYPPLKFVSIKSFIKSPLSILINIPKKNITEYLFFILNATIWKIGALKEWLKK